MPAVIVVGSFHTHVLKPPSLRILTQFFVNNNGEGTALAVSNADILFPQVGLAIFQPELRRVHA